MQRAARKGHNSGGSKVDKRLDEGNHPSARGIEGSMRQHLVRRSQKQDRRRRY